MRNSYKYNVALAWHRGRVWLNMLCLAWILLYAYILAFKVGITAIVVLVALSGPHMDVVTIPAGYLLAANLLYMAAQWSCGRWYPAMRMAAVERLIVCIIVGCFLFPPAWVLVLWLRAGGHA